MVPKLTLIIGGLIWLAVSGLMVSIRSGYDSLPELLTELLAGHARNRVTHAARQESGDEPYRLVREIVDRLLRHDRRDHQRAREQPQCDQ